MWGLDPLDARVIRIMLGLDPIDARVYRIMHSLDPIDARIIRIVGFGSCRFMWSSDSVNILIKCC